MISPTTITRRDGIAQMLMDSATKIEIKIIERNGERNIRREMFPTFRVFLIADCQSKNVMPISTRPTAAPRDRFNKVSSGQPSRATQIAHKTGRATVKLQNIKADGSPLKEALAIQ